MSIFEKSQLELRSNPNVFLNPMENINQRGITDWSEVTDGEYGYDRWMKIDANTKRQPVEDIGLLKSTVYTLSYVFGGSTVSRQITSPASGHWYNSDLDVPLGATLMKLEVGSVATPFYPERAIRVLEEDVAQKGMTEIWTGNANSGTITCEEGWATYDTIIISGMITSINQRHSHTHATSAILDNVNAEWAGMTYIYSTNTVSVYLTNFTATTADIAYRSDAGSKLTGVYGIKY